jgi:hypothetical protein
LSDEELSAKVKEIADQYDKIAAKIGQSVGGVSFSGQFWYETTVAFASEYQEKIDGIATEATEGKRGETGTGVWRGQPTRSGIESANRHVRETESRESDSSLLGGDATGTGIQEVEQSANLYQDTPVWYSELTRQIDALPQQEMTAAEWKALLVKPEETRLSGVRDAKNKVMLDAEGKPVTTSKTIPAASLLPSVKMAEIKATEILEWLDAQGGNITKSQIQQFLAQGGAKLEFQDTVLGDTPLITKDSLIAKEHDSGLALFETIRKEDGGSIEVAGRKENVWDDELHYLLDDGKVTPEQLPAKYQPLAEAWLAAKKENAEFVEPKVEETQFSTYQLPGGENYREAFVTVPFNGESKVDAIARRDATWTRISESIDFPRGEHQLYQLKWARENVPELFKEWISASDRANDFKIEGSWKDGHSNYSGIDNPVVRVRFNDRMDADGKRVLFLEELQPPNTSEFGKMPKTLQDRWLAIGLKRMIRYAAENGYDSVAWTTGEQQVVRYENALRKSVDSIVWEKTPEGVQIKGYKNTGPLGDRDLDALGERVKVADTRYAENDLTEALGKVMADRIRKDPNQTGVIEGESLTVDSVGVKKLYDVGVPALANKILKEMGGGKVVEVNIGQGLKTDIYVQKTDNGYILQDQIAGRFYRDPLDTGGDIDWVETRRDATTFHTESEAMQFAYKIQDLPTGQKQPSFDITPALRERAMGGMSLFQNKNTPRGMYSIHSNMITMLRGSDPSTFLHESLHAWLEEMRIDAARPNARQQIVDDWALVSKFAKIPKDLPFDQPIPVESHELVARGGELYFREGKAPSQELRNAFARFKDWLMRIYRSAKDLNVEISDEMRGFYDRILATDDQISRARESAGITGETILSPDWMTAAEKSAFGKLLAEAKEQAETTVRTELMNELVRERTDFWKSEKKSVTEEVTAEVNEQPVYIALSALQTGKLPDGREIPGIQPGTKLSRDAIVTMYGEEYLKTLPKPFVFQMEGGLHPDVAAEMFGFQTGGEMLAALSNAPDKKTTITTEVDARMMERHGDMMNDGSLAERASEAVANDKQMSVFYREMQILRRNGAKGEMISMDSLQNIAADIITGKKIGELSPPYYQHAAEKAGRDAIRALIGKEPNFERKLSAAFEARQRQILNLALFREAAAAKKETEKSLRKWKVLKKPDKKLAKGRNMDLVNTARAILSNYGLATTDSTPMTFMEQMKEYDEPTYNDLIPLVMTVNVKMPFRELTMTEYRMLRDAVDGLLALSRAANQLMINGKRVEKREDQGRTIRRHGTV